MIKAILFGICICISVLMLWCCVRINDIVELVDEDMSSGSTEVRDEEH